MSSVDSIVEDMFKDPLRSELRDRFRNPIIGSIILVFIVWNWKIPLALIAGPDRDGISRFTFVAEQVAAVTKHDILYCLIAGVVLAFVGPLLKHFFFLWYEQPLARRQAQVKLNDAENLKEVQQYGAELTKILQRTAKEMQQMENITKGIVNDIAQVKKAGTAQGQAPNLDTIQNSVVDISKRAAFWQSEFKEHFTTKDGGIFNDIRFFRRKTRLKHRDLKSS